MAELVREQLLAKTRDELPHAITCRVTEWEWPHIRVEIIVERDSQKAIVIGKGGEVLKAVGIAVREELPEGTYLDLHVKVERHWQNRDEMLNRLGLLIRPRQRCTRRRRTAQRRAPSNAQTRLEFRQCPPPATQCPRIQRRADRSSDASHDVADRGQPRPGRSRHWRTRSDGASSPRCTTTAGP